MNVRVPPSPDVVLAELAPILPALQHSLEAGTAKAHQIWEGHYAGLKLDPWLYPNMVRHEAKRELEAAGVFADYETDNLAFSGLSLHRPRPAGAGTFHIRVWKGGDDWSVVPSPGTHTRLEFFQQAGLAVDGLSSGGDWNLFFLWHLTADGLLESLSIACPMGGNMYRAQCHWHSTVPTPAQFVSPAAAHHVPDLDLTLAVPQVNEGDSE